MRTVPILMYHSVSAVARPAFRRFAVSPGRFRAHLSALRDRGYHALTLADFLRWRAGGGEAARSSLPGRPVVLTFDDAFEDFFTTALPLLEEYGFRASLYVPSAYVGQAARWLHREGEQDRPLMSWDQLREAQRRGTECGGHSRSHPSLDLLPAAQALEEVSRCKAELEDHLGARVRTFAYPYGHYSAATVRAVQQAGYLGACGVRDLPCTPTSPVFALPRWTVTAELTAEGLLERLGRPASPAARLGSDIRRGMSRLVREAARGRP